MLTRIYNSKTNSFTFAALLIASSTLLSAILGLIRDRILAGTFGAGEVLDVYFAAFRIPDFLQSVLVAGGIGAAFLPVFSEEFKKEPKKAFHFANNLLNCFFVFLVILSLFLFFLTPQLLELVAPGFDVNQKAQTVSLTRIMFLSPIFFVLSSVFAGILQYFDRFLVYSLAPLLYNLGIILGILFLVPLFGINGLALGVVLGAFLHFLIQLPAAKSLGYQPVRVFDLKQPALKKVFGLMILPALGLAFSQLNLIVITALASTLSAGSIAIFTFSKNLQYFPIGIVGVSFAISSFPLLSKKWALKEKENFRTNFSWALREILFLTIPLSLLMFILRAQIVRIVLGAGLWGWLETRLTAGSLGIFSLSIFASSLIPFFQKAFYSAQDTKTPTILQIATVFLTIFLSVFFLTILQSQNMFREFVNNFLKLKSIENIQVIAFPLALTVGAFLHSFLLFFIIIKKIDDFKLREIYHSLQKILLSSFLMGAGTWLALRPLAGFFSLASFWGVFFQTLLAGLLGIVIYLLAGWALGCLELKELVGSVLEKTKTAPD